MIITRSPLASALATRDSDVRDAFRMLGRARFYRRNGDPQRAAFYLKLARTSRVCVQMSNLTVKFVADSLHLCGCKVGQRCGCVAPF